MHTVRCGSVLLVILFGMGWSAGCELFGPEPDTSRIQENSVDGIRFGTPMEETLAMLGPSDSGGWVDDFTYGRFWFSKEYRNGPHAGLTVSHLGDVGGIVIDSLYPSDLFFMVEPYAGTTKHGVGVGTSFEFVQHIYGAPVDTLVPPRPGFDSWSVLYCLGRRNLELEIHRDTVYAITLGYHYIPDDPDFPSCRR